MPDLSITTIQSDIFWEDTPRNLDHFDGLLGTISEPTDLILLPEVFNTGFSINPEKCAETMDGPSVRFLRAKAQEKNAVIMGTLLVREDDGCYNRLVCMHPDGEFETYDKRHLFRLSEEYRIFRSGRQKLIIGIRGWNILPVTCYDLRFPVWCKNTWTEGVYAYDLMVCLANWPSVRAHAWKSLLMARAVENQAYVAGVNRIGTDGNGTGHSGDTRVIDAKGRVLYAAAEGAGEVRTLRLSADDLALFRDSYTVGMDWDQFTIKL